MRREKIGVPFDTGKIVLLVDPSARSKRRRRHVLVDEIQGRYQVAVAVCRWREISKVAHGRMSLQGRIIIGVRRGRGPGGNRGEDRTSIRCRRGGTKGELRILRRDSVRGSVQGWIGKRLCGLLERSDEFG